MPRRGGIGFNIAGTSKVEILGGVHTNHGRPLWHKNPYHYIRTNGAEVSIITHFMQSDKTYDVYIQDEREGISKTFPSSAFPEIGTGNFVERIIPLYIGYHRQKE
ncbi:MAG: hypothetical protein ACYS6K_18045 [Planctomycetota bacterium]|jgi:hypothetical protein